jgi:hypothetical protein
LESIEYRMETAYTAYGSREKQGKERAAN